MTIPNKLLKQKDLSPIQKLLIGLILNESPVVLKFAGGYDKTCGQMGTELGLSRMKIKHEFENLVESGYLTTEKGKGWRKTNLTSKCDEFIE